MSADTPDVEDDAVLDAELARVQVALAAAAVQRLEALQEEAAAARVLQGHSTARATQGPEP